MDPLANLATRLRQQDQYFRRDAQERGILNAVQRSLEQAQQPGGMLAKDELMMAAMGITSPLQNVGNIPKISFPKVAQASNLDDWDAAVDIVRNQSGSLNDTISATKTIVDQAKMILGNSEFMKSVRSKNGLDKIINKVQRKLAKV